MTKKNSGNATNKSFSSTPGKYMIGVNGPIKEVDESVEHQNFGNVFERLNGDARAIPDKQKGREI